MIFQAEIIFGFTWTSTPRPPIKMLHSGSYNESPQDEDRSCAHIVKNLTLKSTEENSTGVSQQHVAMHVCVMLY